MSRREQDNRVILQFIKKVRSRIQSNRFMRLFVMITTLGVLGGLLVNAASLIWPIYYAGYISIGVMLAFAIAAMIIPAVTKPSLEECARRADLRGLQERVSTAYELREQETPIAAIQRQNTIHVIRKFSIKEAFPLKFPWKMCVLFVFACMMSFVAANIETPAKVLAQEQHDLHQQIEDEKEVLEEILDDIQEDPSLTEEQKAELEKLVEDAIKELDKADSPEAIEKAEERFRTKLDQALDETVKESENLESMSQSLAQEPEGMTQEEQQQLAQQLEQQAQQSGNEEMEQTAQQMQQELQENGQISDASMNQAQQQVADAQQQSQNMQNALNQAQQQSGNLSYQPSSNNSQQGQQSQQSQQGQQGQEGQQGQQGQSSQGGTGGDGWNTGSNQGQEGDVSLNGEMVTIDGKELGNDENLTGNTNADGSSTTSQSNQSYTWSGQQVDYQQVIGEYTNQAYEDLSGSTIPDSMKDIVKDYFTELNQ